MINQVNMSSVNEKSKNNHIVWVDLEMTGLNIEKDKIIEIACLITDKDLKIVAEGNKVNKLAEYIFY